MTKLQKILFSVVGIISLLTLCTTVFVAVKLSQKDKNLGWTASTNMGVSTANSTNNFTINDVIGSKSDSVTGTSIWAGVDEIQDHLHSAAKVYPTLAAGITVTASSTAWVLGPTTTIVAENKISSPFDIHYINISAVSDANTFELAFFTGTNSSTCSSAGTEIGRVRFTRSATMYSPPLVPFMNRLLTANYAICARIASESAGADTAVVSIFYHTY
jgi:hypothetical protein